MWNLAATTALGALACATAAQLAGATTPGENGRLVFTADAGKHSQLFTIEPDGTGLKQVTHFATGDSGNAAWSSDGKRIIFDGPRGMTTMTADGRGVKVIAPHRHGPRAF